MTTRSIIVDASPLQRLALSAALLGLLALTLANGLGTVLQVRAPELSLKFSPWNAQAAGRLSQRLLMASPQQSLQSKSLAERSLRRDPTVVNAVASTGLIAEMNGRLNAARGRFAYAEWLSRRHLVTELWWVEYGVTKGDIALTLKHYDIALRAIRQAPDALFPVLGSAVAETEVRQGIIALYGKNPPWGDNFLRWLVTNGTANIAAAQLLVQIQANGYRVPAELWGGLEQGLIDQGNYFAAKQLYQGRQKGVSKRVDGSGFSATLSGEKSPFEWTLVDEQGSSAIGRLDGRDALTFATLPTSGGTLARRLQMLLTGSYGISDSVKFEGGPVSGRPYWLLRCIDGRDLGRIALDGQSSIDSNRKFVVPGDCPAQWLMLQVDAGDNAEGSTGAVFQVELKRL